MIHNFFQMFRKDKGAHFSYNIGVFFVRVSFVLFVIGMFGLLYVLISPGPELESLGMAYAKVRDTYIADEIAEPHYIVDFEVSFISGGTVVHKQEVGKSVYPMYKELVGQEAELYGLYRGVSEDLIYVTKSSLFDARREYGKAHISMLRQLVYMAVILCLPLGLIIFLVGAGQERLAMKYPRSDVPLFDDLEESYDSDLAWEEAVAAAERQKQQKSIPEFDDIT